MVAARGRRVLGQSDFILDGPVRQLAEGLLGLPHICTGMLNASSNKFGLHL